MKITEILGINKNDLRTYNAQKNISISVVIKAISILLSLVMIPMAIGLVDETRYGIWLTMTSIVYWFTFFDFGFSNGFRNRFAECIARGEEKKAKTYVSTTYVILFPIFIILLLLILFINRYVDWAVILNINPSLNNELQLVFAILAICLCLKVPLNTISSLLMADQKPAMASFITLSGQILSLVFLYWMEIKSLNSLPLLTLVTSGSQCLVILIFSILLFATKYRKYIPSLFFFEKKIVKNIFILGGKFFLLQILMIFIYQFVNVIISRVNGPIAVTQYNIAYKYFNIISTLMIIILSTFWSPITDAYEKKEYKWIANTYKKLLTFWCFISLCSIIMLALSPFVYKIWVKDVYIPPYLSIGMSIYVIIYSLASIPEYIINGIGKLNIQVILYLFYSLISIPLMFLLCKILGVIGILIVLSIIGIISFIMLNIQIKKILFRRASNKWNI